VEKVVEGNTARTVAATVAETLAGALDEAAWFFLMMGRTTWKKITTTMMIWRPHNEYGG
jgi:hypothetical protein